MSIEVKAALFGLPTALLLLGVAFGLSPLLQPGPGAQSNESSASLVSAAATPGLEKEARQGHKLFAHNCAHCHGDDARGDEGPSLYDLKKTDGGIARTIKGGIKGEMPRFGSKFSDAEIDALIAFLRTLNESK